MKNLKLSQNIISFKSVDYQRMIEIGEIFSHIISNNKLHLIYLKGELGSGKTTLIRSIIRGLGYSESIPSPSFSIAEIYKINKIEGVHIDMFRIISPESWRREEVRSYFED